MPGPSGTPVVVPINGYSDGDSGKWPPGAPYVVNNSDIYLVKVATLWMDTRNEANKGTKYILDRLPEGYRLFEKPRIQGSSVRADKYLFGHPKGKAFDSPNQFFIHFKFLMEHDEGDPASCGCKVCETNSATASTKAPKTATKKTPRLGREIPKDLIDPDGNPDVVGILQEKLRKFGKVDQKITEPQCPDWRFNEGIIEKYIVDVTRRASYIPRLGEIVLFIERAPEQHELGYDAVSHTWRFYHSHTKEWAEMPYWKAGVLTKKNLELDPIVEGDLIAVTDKKYYVGIHGFRIDSYPDPNSNRRVDKMLSMAHKLLPLHLIRPFCFLREVCWSVPDEELDQTIHNALTITCSVSYVHRFRFKGTWPNHKLFMGGLWFGHELVLVDDAVRLLPAKGSPKGTPVTNVLLVKECIYRYERLDDANEFDMSIWLRGTKYTTDEADAWVSPTGERSAEIPTHIIRTEFTSGMHGYHWWPMQAAGYEARIPIENVIGRCYGAHAVEIWTCAPATLDYGDAVTMMNWARAVSTKKLKRLDETHFDYHMSDSRIEQLDLGYMNSEKVGPMFPEKRPMTGWRRTCRVLDGFGSKRDKALIDKGQFNRPVAGPLARLRKDHGLSSAAPELDDDDEDDDDDDDDDDDEDEQESDEQDDPEIGEGDGPEPNQENASEPNEEGDSESNDEDDSESNEGDAPELADKAGADNAGSIGNAEDMSDDSTESSSDDEDEIPGNSTQYNNAHAAGDRVVLENAEEQHEAEETIQQVIEGQMLADLPDTPVPDADIANDDEEQDIAEHEADPDPKRRRLDSPRP